MHSEEDYQFSSSSKSYSQHSRPPEPQVLLHFQCCPSWNESTLLPWNGFTQRERIIEIVNQFDRGVRLVTSDVDACSAGGISYARRVRWQAEGENRTPPRTADDTNSSPVRLDNHFRYRQAHAGA
jgi:hypothetical protein